MKILFFVVMTLVILLSVIGRFFLPKWLYWISPKAYSAWDVLSEQYGNKTSIWIIIIVSVIGFGIFFLLEYGSYAGW